MSAWQTMTEGRVRPRALAALVKSRAKLDELERLVGRLCDLGSDKRAHTRADAAVCALERAAHVLDMLAARTEMAVYRTERGR